MKKQTWYLDNEQLQNKLDSDIIQTLDSLADNQETTDRSLCDGTIIELQDTATITYQIDENEDVCVLNIIKTEKEEKEMENTTKYYVSEMGRLYDYISCFEIETLDNDFNGLGQFVTSKDVYDWWYNLADALCQIEEILKYYPELKAVEEEEYTVYEMEDYHTLLKILKEKVEEMEKVEE